MPIILVVDDSEVDRRLMAGLLGADVDWLVSHASNGADALETISYATPDVVVTDLLMPEMDGMELVANLAESFPELPVVLVTGQDDAEIALKALRAGAASFVPKSQLTERLLDTVEQVLGVRDADHKDVRIVDITTNMRYRFTLENDPSLIFPLIDRVQAGMIGMNLCSPAQRLHCGIALEEALINAMCHGNLEIPKHRMAEVRHLLHENKPSELIEDRRRKAPFNQREIQVAADFTRNRAQFVVADQGEGFDFDAYLPSAPAENLDESTSRGLVLIQAFMDEVIFNPAGTEMRMTLKDLRPIASAVGAGGMRESD